MLFYAVTVSVSFFAFGSRALVMRATNPALSLQKQCCIHAHREQACDVFVSW